MSKIKEAFDVFHAENPHIYYLMVMFAKQLLNAGQKKLSISLITERVRWETKVSVITSEPFKINNNFRALYSRMIEKEYPEFKGMFVTRTLRES